jgi:RNA polymerase sigma factor (TIGR02999 family)
MAADDQPMHEVTRILEAIQGGDLKATDELLPIVYNELRRLAAIKLSQEKPGQTLQATALVHEAYLRLVGSDDDRWQSSRHFFAAAAEAMRRILVERARRKSRLRHGGGRRRIDLEDAQPAVDAPLDDLLALDEALAKLTAEDELKADLVKLHCFAGLTLPEAAKALAISVATAERHWAYARAWLRAEMAGGQ